MSLYIHQLKDLTPKSADIESTFIIRDLKKTTPLPLTYESVFEYFALFFVSESEKNTIANAIDQVEPAILAIKELALRKDPDFEMINLKRAAEMLNEMPTPLTLNLGFAKNISLWQEEFTQDFAPLMNSLQILSSQQEKVNANNELNKIFQKLLRNDQMAFNYKELIYEAQKNRMSDLHESMENGFFFRVFLEEELRKTSFADLKRRIPEAKLHEVDDIRLKIREIKKGVDAAYDINVRMMNWALVVYAYIKMMLPR